MPSRQEILVQEDWSIGMFRAVAAHLIPERGFHTGLNALLDIDGSVYKRGGTKNLSTAGLGTTRLTYLWEGFLDPGARTLIANNADFGVLNASEGVVNLGSDGLTAPVKSAQLEGKLFIGGGYIYGGSRKTASFVTAGGNTNITNGSKVVTDASGGFTANVDVGMLMQNGTERTYVVASVDSDTQVTLRDAYEGTTTTTANPTFHNIYKIVAADPYEDADFYSVVANRLIVSSTNVLKFSEIGKPHSFKVNDFHEVPEGVRVVGHAALGQACLIFTTIGVWGLDGLAFDIVDAAGNPQHRLQQLSRDLILWHPAGIATYENALIIAGTDGIFLLDASAGRELLTRSIDTLYNDYVDLGYRPGGLLAFRNHLFVPIMGTGADVKDMLVCRLDKPVVERDLVYYPWTQFDGQGGKITTFAVRAGEVARDPMLLGASGKSDARVLDCSKFFTPTGTVKKDADATTPEYDLITRDYGTGGLTENVIRFIRTRYELADAATDNPTLRFEFSLGDRIAVGENLWNQVQWNDAGSSTDFRWAGGESEVSFNDLACPAAEEEGTDPHRCRVGKRARFMRFRIRNTEPAATCVVRSLELFIRPSRAVRR